MAKAVTYFSVKGGLNTEANPLNIPPEDCVDILNCNLNVDGSVERRAGIDFLVANGCTEASTGFISSYPIDMYVFTTNTPIIQYGIGDPQIYNRFLAVKAGYELRIYPFVDIAKLSGGAGFVTPQIINLEQSTHNTIRTSFASFGDTLVLLNKDLPFQYITILSNVFVVVRDNIYIRDFNMTSPILDSTVKVGTNAYKCIRTHYSDDPRTEPEVGDDWRKYWAFIGPADAETAWAADLTASVYVSRVVFYTLTDFVWEEYRAIADSTDIEPGVDTNWRAYWEYLGTFPTSTLTQWNSVTSYVATFGTPYTTSAKTMFQIYGDNLGFDSGCFSSGRLWLTGDPRDNNAIYVSQSIVNGSEFIKMHQFADPYSPLDSEVVDTDGAVITIAEASRILRVEPYNFGVLAFAENGVWYLGGSEGFKTMSFSIQKISDIGILTEGAVAAIESGVIFFGENGIYGIRESTSGSGFPEAQLVSDKIQTFYRDLPQSAKLFASTVFDKINKRLYYFYATAETWNANRCLVLDTRTGSWFKHSIDSQTSAIISHFVPIPESFEDSELLFVIQQAGDIWGFGRFSSGVWSDFTGTPTEKVTYSSYITMAHQNYGTVIRKREATYMTTVFERLEPTYDGGCLMRIDWNWAKTSASPYFGTARQVYFPNKFITSLYNDTLNGLQTVVTKHKIRGWGNVFRFHFESEGDKPFKLLGWELLVEVDPTP